MPNSILQCSGRHWQRAGLAWLAFLGAVALVPVVRAVDAPPRKVASARLDAQALLPAFPKVNFVAGRLVRHEHETVDFNRLDVAAFGDAEEMPEAAE